MPLWMDSDSWMESNEWMRSGEFLRTCSCLHWKACQGTLTVEDIDQAIQSWEHRGYKAYNRIIFACTKDVTMELWCISYMHDICHAMTPESVKSVEVPPFLMGDDHISSVLRERFVRSCHNAASRLWIPPHPDSDVLVYSGHDHRGGEGYAIYLIVKRPTNPDDEFTGFKGIWYLYEYHDWDYRPHRVKGSDGMGGYCARGYTLAQVLDRCGESNHNSCRDLQMCLCKYVESKYHVINDDLLHFKTKYRVVLSLLPNDHQAAIAYIITRTRTNYKFRGINVPVGIYGVKSLDQALQNWVASTMRVVRIDYIEYSTFHDITHFNDRTFDECCMGTNSFVKSQEHAVRRIQRRWRQIIFNPNHHVGRRKVIRGAAGISEIRG